VSGDYTLSVVTFYAYIQNPAYVKDSFNYVNINKKVSAITNSHC